MSIDNNQEYEAELITLIDDEGTEHEFEIIDELENDDGYFMALVPTLRDAQSEVADADEYYIFEVVEDENGEEQLCARSKTTTCWISSPKFSRPAMHRLWRKKRSNLLSTFKIM